MENEEVIQLNNNNKPQSKGLVLRPEEKKRLIDFFALLIEIDRRENLTKTYEKPNK